MPSVSKPSNRLGLRVEQARWELPLPDGARRLIASGDFDGRDNESLVVWLNSDPILSDRLLRWCNAPLYNLSQPYQSLKAAATVMDGRDLSQLAVLAWIRGLFAPERQIDIYTRGRLWAHSISVAAVSSLIARTCTEIDASMAFIAGALHDIGMIASERLDAESFAETLSLVDELSPVHDVEMEQQGWNHGQLGSAILEQWGMPESISLAALHHHSPHKILQTAGSNLNAIDSQHADMVCCVAIANYLCSRAGWGSLSANSIAAPKDRVFQHLGIDSGLLTILWQQLYPTIESVAVIR
ncbi:HDOD domain-containing protein [Rubripirellula amarantea]|uniref:HDOD domain protein n=1 Tax=Rubripirellula amarantea TaxID=2527999 RepID=A0A5C5WUL5_9BACT|nr:HDOD domain-containing protein [Rubripirellula amarantea]MDA8744228.1 HDOD domain-containing protein [Rubripirellula amarantea]TWT54250.1 HDOD domain protein [Rubripirellula amarantea]